MVILAGAGLACGTSGPAGGGDSAASSASDGAGAAQPSDAAGGVPFELTVDRVEPLISDVDVDLVFPAAIDVDGAGNLWVADRNLHRVLIVDAAGELLRTIGRAGGGPGEFRGPRGVGVRGDLAYVLDNAHGVQWFDMRGDYVGEYSAPRALLDFDFVGDGGVVASNNRVWARGGLVLAVGPDGEERGLIGEPPFEGAEGFNFRDVREAILSGEIPEMVRNGSLPIAAPDGTLWVVVHTEALLRRYGPDGALQLETPFELPELPAIEAQYFEDFRSAPQGDVFFFPSFVADGVAADDGVMLLWNTVPGAPGLVTVHDGTGALVQRLLLPTLDTGGGGFNQLSIAIDPPRRRLYVAVPDIATVFRAEVPDGAYGF